jgi:hypothetical protein
MWCIAENLVRMISKQGGVKSRPEVIVCRVDHLFPCHVTNGCVRTDPSLSFTWLVTSLI